MERLIPYEWPFISHMIAPSRDITYDLSGEVIGVKRVNNVNNRAVASTVTSHARRRNRAAQIPQHDSRLSGPRWAGPGPLSRMSCSAWPAMAYLSPLPPEVARRSLAL